MPMTEDGQVEVAAAATSVVEVADQTVTEAPLVEDELLVEDVSIDGMCGVY